MKFQDAQNSPPPFSRHLEQTSSINLCTTGCKAENGSLQMKVIFFFVVVFFFSPCLFILNFLLGFHGCYEFQQLNTPNAGHNLASQQNRMRPDFISPSWI